MAYFHPAWVEHQRRHWMRPDAERYVRPDAHRFMPPGTPQRLGKDAVRYFWPEHKTQPARAHHETAQARDGEFLRELVARREDLLRLRRELAAINAELKFRRFIRSLKAGFNPGQPRVPRGNPGGGQWTSEGGTGAGEGSGRNDPRILSDATPDNDWQPGAQYAQNRARGGPILINGRMVTPTPAQAARLAVAEARAGEAINRVHEVDPNWRPSPSAYESVEGLIRAREADAQQAQARFLELQRHGIGPGPFAGDSIPARGPERDYRSWEIEQNNQNGAIWGCHTCGTFNPGTRSGNYVLDHQPPTGWNPRGLPQRLFPQCTTCSARQGGWITRNRGTR
jgi:hypothetical protein